MMFLFNKKKEKYFLSIFFHCYLLNTINAAESSLLWASSGGGSRAFASAAAYMNLFSNLGWISEENSRFDVITANSGGAQLMLQAFFSRNFFNRVVMSNDLVETMEEYYNRDRDNNTTVVDDPRCDGFAALGVFGGVFGELQNICNTYSPYDFNWVEVVTDDMIDTSTFFDDPTLSQHSAEPSSKVLAFRETDLMIEIGISPTARVSDGDILVALGPRNDVTKVYTSAITAYYTVGTSESFWKYEVPDEELPFTTKTYVSPLKYDESDWIDYQLPYPVTPFSKNATPSLLTEIQLLERTSDDTIGTFREPFFGEPTTAQLASGTTALYSTLSAASPATLAMTGSTFQRIISSLDLPEPTKLFASSVLDNTLDYIQTSDGVFDDFAVCSQSEKCGVNDGRLLDGGFLDGVTFAGAVGRLQRLQPEKKIKAIITNYNLGSIRAGINFLGFFETKWNAGVQPGEYYWPFDPDSPSDILINTVPQRSYQIFGNELLNETSLADITEGIPGDDTNITIALFEDATTIDNPAYDIRAGTNVSILYIELNAFTPRTGPVDTQDLLSFIRTITTNPELKRRIQEFVEDDDPITDFPTVTPTKTPPTPSPTRTPIASPTPAPQASRSKKSSKKRKKTKKEPRFKKGEE